jgi:hypothetical protein
VPRFPFRSAEVHRRSRETPSEPGPSLFDPPAAPVASSAVAERMKRTIRERAAKTHRAAMEQLVPVALEVALRAGPQGCTVGDIRLLAQRRGLIPQIGEGRQLSYLAALPKQAGLVSTGDRRMSPIPRSRNDLVVYLHPRFTEPARDDNH